MVLDTSMCSHRRLGKSSMFSGFGNPKQRLPRKLKKYLKKLEARKLSSKNSIALALINNPKVTNNLINYMNNSDGLNYIMGVDPYKETDEPITYEYFCRPLSKDGQRRKDYFNNSEGGKKWNEIIESLKDIK